LKNFPKLSAFYTHKCFHIFRHFHISLHMQTIVEAHCACFSFRILLFDFLCFSFPLSLSSSHHLFFIVTSYSSFNVADIVLGAFNFCLRRMCPSMCLYLWRIWTKVSLPRPPSSRGSCGFCLLLFISCFFSHFYLLSHILIWYLFVFVWFSLQALSESSIRLSIFTFSHIQFWKMAHAFSEALPASPIPLFRQFPYFSCSLHLNNQPYCEHYLCAVMFP
jgi:hypothetical protein